MVLKSQFLDCSIYIVVYMKVSIAVIKLVLRTNKTLADGSHPIMLRVSFNGMKERSSGYSCTEKFWSKKDECVKKGFPNYAIINHEIQKMKNEAIERRNEFERLGKVYTPSMVLAREEVRNAVTNDLSSLIQRYIDEKGLENKTIEKWNIVKRSLCKFSSNDLIVDEMNEAFCRRYCRWLEDRGLASGSIRSYMGKVAAILHYAHKLKLIDEYPLSGFKYHKDYREAKNELYIHSRTLDVMMEMFLDECIERHGNRWTYLEGVTEQLMDIHSELYAHYLYVIGIWMKGIAPVDISFLKKKDIKVVDIKGKSYYAIDGRRSKTGMLYKVRVLQNCVESNVLIRTMLMFNDGTDYFLPTLKDYVGKDMKKRVNNLYTYHGEHLVNWFQRINEECVRRNVENGDNIPLIDLECRYYSYRHSYIMKEIQKPTVNLLALAQTVGKSATTLHQYISLLGEVDLV